MVGVEMDWYVDAMTEHRDGLLRALARHAGDLDLVAANVALSERMMKDLHGALLGFRDLDAVQNDVLLRVLEAASVGPHGRRPRALRRGRAGGHGRHAGLLLHARRRSGAGGERDRRGSRLRCVRRGRPARQAQPVLTSGSMPAGQGAIGRAWRSGQVQRVHSYQTDPTVAPWREAAERYGWRANASVPLTDPRGVTRALLSLHARWPGFFASESRLAMLEQVKSVVERALTDLEERPTLASGVSAYGERSTHLQLLAEGRVEMLFQPVVSLPQGGLRKLEALARLRGDEPAAQPGGVPAGVRRRRPLRALRHRPAAVARRARVLAAGGRARRGVGQPAGGRRRLTPATCGRSPRCWTSTASSPAGSPWSCSRPARSGRPPSERGRPFDDFKDLGVRLAQDDLGSGYSSLLRLRHFAFDDVKIDQSLVRGTELAPGAALHFIKPINDIAHSLGLTVVIEGLESDGLIEAAVQLGVDMGQGYGIARPMPADEVVAWAAGYRLDVDPVTPRTPLGAIAAHVAWEHRMVAIGDHVASAEDSGLGCCGLTRTPSGWAARR